MPLEQSGSKEARERNIKREIEAGKDPKQAAAIGYAVQRRNDGPGNAGGYSGSSKNEFITRKKMRWHNERMEELQRSGMSREEASSQAAKEVKAQDFEAEWKEHKLSKRNDSDTGEPHTTHAAGILFVTEKGCALFLKRGPGGDHPGEWCFPGGHCEEGETIEECAIREAEEEVGKLPSGELEKWARARTPNPLVPAPTDAPQPEAVAAAVPTPTTDFTTFLMQVKEEFAPKLNGEHVGYAWAPLSEPPEPLHPGCRVALERFTMNEMDVATAIRDGRLASPQKYMNVWLFNMRITGTGLAYRHKLKEFVWRDASLYMNEDFVARCNGLAVIFEHPQGKKAMLDTKEFSDRVVGSIVLPYLRPELEEVWGVAKIYDEPTAHLMEEEQLSTSPAVVFKPSSGNNKVALENGQMLLVEGEPALVDHLAICEQGVWDKGGDPVGIETHPEVKIDSTLPFLQKVKKRMDVIRLDDACSRMDAVLKRR